MKNQISCALGALLLLTASATAQSTTCENFDGGSANGWTGHPFSAGATHVATGGNPNGWLNTTDNGNNPDWFSPTGGMYSANYRVNNVTKITVDLKEESGPRFAVWLVLINDPDPLVNFDESFAFVMNNAGADSPQSGSGWTTYEFDVPAASMISPTTTGPGSPGHWGYFGAGVGGSDDDKWNTYMTGGTTRIQFAIANNPIIGFDLLGTPWDYGIDNVCYTADLPSISFCNGDGGNQMGCTNCPCGNNTLPGTPGGCLNSAGTSSLLTASGDPSVSLPSGASTDLRFGIGGVPANAFCILNSGDAVAPGNPANPCFGLNSGAQAAAFDGLRCAITNTRRHGGRSADGNGDVGLTNSPWGGEGGPPVGIAVAGGGFASGQTRYFQVINRDDAMAVCMRGLNTSQALEITFTP